MDSMQEIKPRAAGCGDADADFEGAFQACGVGGVLHPGCLARCARLAGNAGQRAASLLKGINSHGLCRTLVVARRKSADDLGGSAGVPLQGRAAGVSP
jgi:hypothetical protein